MSKAIEIEKQRKQVIIDALKGKPDINENVWRRVQKRGIMSRQTFFNTRGMMREFEEINEQKFYGLKILWLPEDEKLMKEKFGITESKNISGQLVKEKYGVKETKEISEEYKDEYRRKHTEDIKREVIEPWLKALPAWIPWPAFSIRFPITPNINWALFNDFKNHIKFTPNPFDEFEIYGEKEDEFFQKREEIHSMFLKIVYEELDLGDKNFWFTENDIPQRALPKIDNIDASMKYGLILSDVCDWIFDIMKEWYCSGWDSVYIDFMAPNFHSYMKKSAYTYRYYIKRYDDRDICCGSIKKRLLGKNNIKFEIDKRIRKILERVKESKDIHDDIIELHKMEGELIPHVKKIKESLMKHLALPILPNDCEFYPWK